MKPAYLEIFRQMDAVLKAKDYASMRPLFEPDATVLIALTQSPIPVWEAWFDTMTTLLERQVWVEQGEPIQLEPDQVNRVWRMGIRGDDGHVYTMEGCTVFTFSAKQRIASLHYIMDLPSQRLLLLGKP